MRAHMAVIIPNVLLYISVENIQVNAFWDRLYLSSVIDMSPISCSDAGDVVVDVARHTRQAVLNSACGSHLDECYRMTNGIATHVVDAPGNGRTRQI